MGNLDNTRSVTLLFGGAFLISLGLIAFLNVEMQSRSKYGGRIKNENFFEVFGKKFSEIVAKIKEKNSYRRSTLYHLLSSKNTRVPLRKLQYFAGELNNVNNMFELDQNRTFHRLRHKKKIRRLTEFRVKQKLNLSSREMTIGSEQNDIPDGDNFTLFVNNLNNRTVQWFKFPSNSTNIEFSKDILKEKLGTHRNCYTTNDVLEIIAITCLVNFVFWFIIISCVNTLTRNRKIGKSDSCESLTSIESGAEPENQICDKNDGKPTFGRRLSCNVDVQDYVNSLKMEAEAEIRENEPRILFKEKYSVLKSTPERKNVEKWKNRRFTRFPHIFFDIISSDHTKGTKEKKFVCRTKSKKIFNSLSMEDLIV